MSKRDRQPMRTPDAIPFYGMVEYAVISVARDNIKEFLDLAPGVTPTEIMGAMMHLDLAVNLMDLRQKTVLSIQWNRSPKAVRDDIWKQLLFIEMMVAHNLDQFGKWWDDYHDQFDEFPVQYPPNPGLRGMEQRFQDQHQAFKEGDFYYSSRQLMKFIREFKERRSRNPIQLSLDDAYPELPEW
jgi:hypothetical protein